MCRDTRNFVEHFFCVWIAKIEKKSKVTGMRQVYIGLGVGADLVRGETIVGRGSRRIRARHVERNRLRYELALRGHGCAQSRGLLQSAEREGERGPAPA